MVKRKGLRRRSDRLKDMAVVLAGVYSLMNIYGWIADRLFK